MSKSTSQSAAERKSIRHVLELDGIRGLAIAAVMALHFLYIESPQGLVESAVSKIAGYGLWGVDLFFVLSGFLITGILFDDKDDPRYFRNFYMRRTLRIFPLYYGVLLVLLVLLPGGLARAFDPQLLETRKLQGWLWSYLTNVYVGSDGRFSIPYVSHFWSLAVEEHFYLVWPFLIASLSRQRAMATCLGLSAIALILRISLSLSGYELYSQVLTPCRLDTLCFGGLAALVLRGPEGGTLWALRAKFCLPIAAALLFSLSVLQKLSPGAVVVEVRATVLAVFFALVVMVAADHSGPRLLKTALRNRALVTLGKYSYGLYVFHGLIAYAFERHTVVTKLARVLESHTLATLVQAAAGVALSLLVAVASYELYEVRFLKLKKLFGDGRARKGDRQVAGPSPEPRFSPRSDLGTQNQLATETARIGGRGTP